MLSSTAYLQTTAYTEINSLNDFQRVINNNKPTVLLFYAPWCNACTAMKPLFKESAQNYGDKAQFIILDVTKDELKDAIDTFGIQGVPTLCYKEVGLKTSEQFNKRLTSFLGQPVRANSTRGIKKPVKKPAKNPKLRTTRTTRTGK